MAARIIDGKAIAADVRAEVRRGVDQYRERYGDAPGLATVLVGHDPASKIYIGAKHRASEDVGINSIGHELPADTPEEQVLDLIEELNADDSVSGFIVQLPLPPQVDPARVVAAVDPYKDVDGLTPTNAGLLV